MLEKWITQEKLADKLHINIQTLKIYLSRVEFNKYVKFTRKGQKDLFLYCKESINRIYNIFNKKYKKRRNRWM